MVVADPLCVPVAPPSPRVQLPLSLLRAAQGHPMVSETRACERKRLHWLSFLLLLLRCSVWRAQVLTVAADVASRSLGVALRLPLLSLPPPLSPLFSSPFVWSSSAGGAQERRDIQRAPGQLRLVDEHQPARRDLHVSRRHALLAAEGVLHPRQHHQVPAHTG